MPLFGTDIPSERADLLIHLGAVYLGEEIKGQGKVAWRRVLDELPKMASHKQQQHLQLRRQRREGRRRLQAEEVGRKNVSVSQTHEEGQQGQQGGQQEEEQEDRQQGGPQEEGQQGGKEQQGQQAGGGGQPTSPLPQPQGQGGQEEEWRQQMQDAAGQREQGQQGQREEGQQGQAGKDEPLNSSDKAAKTAANPVPAAAAAPAAPAGPAAHTAHTFVEQGVGVGQAILPPGTLLRVHPNPKR